MTTYTRFLLRSEKGQTGMVIREEYEGRDNSDIVVGNVLDTVEDACIQHANLYFDFKIAEIISVKTGING